MLLVLPFRVLTLVTCVLLFIPVRSYAAFPGGAEACSITIQSTTVTDEQCPGAANGSLTVTASCDNCSGELEYSIDGTNYQWHGSFWLLAPGNYTVHVREVGTEECVATQNFIIGNGADTQAPKFGWSGSFKWDHKENFQATDGLTNDGFGNTMAVEGTRAVVGAPDNDEGGADAGAAYVYNYTDTGWVQQAKILAPVPTAGNEFGSAVSISGEYILVGEQNNDIDGQNAGRVYVFTQQGSNWVHQFTISPSEPIAEGRFGTSVSLFGSYAMIGSPGADGAGAAYVYLRSGTTWVREAKLQADDIEPEDEFGFSVNLKGSRAIIGAPEADEGFYRNVGAAYVFSYDGSSWRQDTELLAIDMQRDDNFGYSVDIDGTLAIVGAPNEDAGGSNGGAAYAFKDNFGTWELMNKLADFEINASANLGTSVIVNGNDIVIGAPGKTVNGLNSAGAVYTYYRKYGHAIKGPVRVATDPQSGGRFGVSVAASGNNLLVGSEFADGNKTDAGLTYYLERTRYLFTSKMGYCGSPIQAEVPPGTDNCAGNLTATTSDATTFDAVGTYTIEWTLDDGKGNKTVAKQNIEVEDRPVTVTSVATTAVSCPGERDGSITVSAECDDCRGSLEYSLDGLTYQRANTFTGLAPGDYTIDVRGSGWNDCGVIATASVSAPIDDVSPVPTSPAIVGWQQAKTHAAAYNADDFFGSRVAVSDSFAVVAGRYNDPTYGRSDAVYILKRDNGEWIESDILVPSDHLDRDDFGESVATFGNYIVVGSPRGSAGINSGQQLPGVAYIFKRNGDAWVEQIRISGDATDDRDNFGSSVAIDGDVVAISAYSEDSMDAANSGAVYLFRRDGEIWARDQKITSGEPDAYGHFGGSLSISGNFVAVGVLSDNTKASYAGAAYVYAYNEGEEEWSREAKVFAENPVEGDHFGSNIDISGNRMIVGARNKSVDTSRFGVAYIFERTDSGWVQTERLIGSEDKHGQKTGLNVTIDGNYVAMAAVSSDDNPVYLFHYNDGWNEVAKLSSTRNQNYTDRYGAALAISGTTVLTGASWDQVSQSPKGAVYFISPVLPSDTIALCGQSVNAISPSATDNCAGLVEGVAKDATFGAEGTYPVEWSFKDGNGNITTAKQNITVVDRRITVALQSGRLPSCPGAADGRLELSASCADCENELQYSLDGVSYQSDPVFYGLSAGEYTVHVRENGGYACSTDLTVDFNDQVDDGAPDFITLAGAGWRQTKTFRSLAQAGDHYGSSVAVDGNYAVVGVSGFDTLGGNYGSATVLEQVDGEWIERASLLASDRKKGDVFGISVDISGDYIVVGSNRRAVGSGTLGAAYVFKREGDTWLEQAKLTGATSGEYGYFGDAVAIGGDFIAVGARATSDVGSYQGGGVYVFKRSGDTWQLDQKFKSSTSRSRDQFGKSVDLSGNYLVVGAWGNDAGGTSAGAAYVFHRDESGWVEQSGLVPANLVSNDHFGYDVAISGNQVIVGARNKEVGGTRTAAAMTFQRIESTWFQTGLLVGSDTQESQASDLSVDISGDYALLGTYWYATSGVYVFHHVDEWTEQAKLESTSMEGYTDNYGASVAISGSTLMIGAMKDRDRTGQAGTVYFASPVLASDTLLMCGPPVTVENPTAIDGCAGQVMGTTTNPVTFSMPGTYHIEWSFDDSNGNNTTATQTIVVEPQTFNLPIVETVETNSPTRDCWTTPTNQWGPRLTLGLASTGSSFFYLPPSDVANGLDEVLYSPTFGAEAGMEYLLSFSYRDDFAGGNTALTAVLIDATDDSVVKQLFSDESAALNYGRVHLRYSVPTDGSYRIAFESQSNMLGDGLMLDDILIDRFNVPADGADRLISGNYGLCTDLPGFGLYGDAWTRFLSPNGKVALEINSNGNDLGDVTVAMTDYDEPPLAPFIGDRLLSRYFNITPEHGSGPYTANGGVKVRMYFLNTELGDFSDVRGRSRDWSSLVVTHYDAGNTDCRLENSTDEAFEVHLPSDHADFGGTAHYLEFTTQSFSEFGATTDQAAPVVLTAFTAREDGPVNRLAWTVASEIDFSHYEVQRSTTGTDFVAFAEVAGRNLTDYASSDPAPAPLTYYRLKMVDYDGTYAYSPVVSVNRKQNAATALQAYPVPSTNRVTLRFNVLRQGEHYLTLSDALGRTVSTQTFHAPAGVHERPVELGDLPTGTYQLVLKASGETRSVRIVKN